ncbi:hypothetical protein [Botrimarina hoheduenensis]|uniref:Bacterial extracellular solute-binding protein n=1 Tax=Botrimarina hoheduenensis TaxID=2528000 RepID=A0A5C5WEW2_9BACT|nr:hypothetical protein [Botrimarina hoheduenensis]TWT48643.1 hypothetical protein Pla111_04180 [Botrimarina hoheduenensis]
MNDRPLAGALDRLRGEWRQRSAGAFSTTLCETCDEASIAASDLIVFPSAQLGKLCENNQLRAVRRSVLASEELNFNDLFSLVRDVEIVYGGCVMALPLGCPCPLLIAEDSSVSAAGVSLIDQPDNRSIALAFLACVAPQAVHRSEATTLWDAESLRPRLTSPPFVRVLRKLTAGSDRQPVARLVWPQRAGAVAPPSQFVATAPGSDEVFNPLAEAWEPTNDRKATLLASSGRLVAVTTSSRNAASAFRLAAWLASSDVTGQLARSTDGIANCRVSRSGVADHWLASDPAVRGGEAFSAALAESLTARRALLTPRLPGAERYLDELGSAIRLAVEGQASPELALAGASAAWEDLSDEIGREAQLAAYLRSVNARDYSPPTK